MAPFSPIPDGDHNDPWKSLLRYAFPVIDEVSRKYGVAFPIRIGGGSMLLRRYRHRKSWDLDLFVTDARLVRWASPRRNEAAADIFPDYAEEATATKLVIGLQEVDFIVAPPVFEPDDAETAEFFGRSVSIDRPREILAKKLVYRGSRLHPRDVFDLAAVASVEPAEVAAVATVVTIERIEGLLARLDRMKPTFEKDIADKVIPYPDFAPLVDRVFGIAEGIFQGWRTRLASAAVGGS